jgi:hypothetical protein
MSEYRRGLRRKALTLVLFLAIVGILVLLIRVSNWLPLAMQKESLRSYRSIEAVQAELRLPHIYVPTYFPQTISWPPAYLFAQAKPFPGVLMSFTRAEAPRDVLVIAQSRAESFSRLIPCPLEHISAEVWYDFHGRKAFLEVGLCKDEEPCSRIRWHENGSYISVFMRDAPFELIRIAESMLP